MTRWTLALTLGAFLAGAGAAQLRETPQATARLPILKGGRLSGDTLTRGPLKITLDTAGGRVAGLLIEAPTLPELARGMGAAFGQDETQLQALVQSLSGGQFQAAARTGFVDYADASASAWLGVKLSGKGSAQRWRAYVALNIWPDSAFPKTNNVTGNPKAAHQVRIFSDFQCPYCQQLWQTSLGPWRQPGGEYRTSYYQYPLDFHPHAMPTAIASECAGEQRKFWSYADQLFADLKYWSALSAEALPGRLLTYAKVRGLDARKFTQCIARADIRQRVQAQLTAGTRLGVQGTPTVFLNGIKLRNYTNPEEWRAVLAITGAKPSVRARIAERLKGFEGQ